MNTTAAEFSLAPAPVIGFAMLAVSHVAETGSTHGAAAIGDAGYGMLIGILLLMSLPRQFSARC